LKSYTLYKLTFPNSKIYIGQTVNFKNRMNFYKSSSINKSCSNYDRIVNRAIRKYGWENVQKEILLICGSQIDMYERQYIRLLKTTDIEYGYNIEEGGNKNKVLSVSHRKKMVDNSYLKGKFGSEHHKSRPILQFDLNGNFIKEWESITSVSIGTGIGQGNLSSYCLDKVVVGGDGSGYRLNCLGGFIWFYKDNFSNEKLLYKIKKIKK